MNDLINTHGAFELRMRRRLSTVPRWVTIRTLRKETVGEHSFQVCSISLWLLGYHVDKGPGFQFETMRHAIEHDQDEALTGDTPGYMKGTGVETHGEPVPGVIVPQHKVVVKCADIFDAYAWAWEDWEMGNSMMMPIIVHMERRIHKWWPMFDWATLMCPKPTSEEIMWVFRTPLEDGAMMHPGLEKMAKEWLNARR